jgi:hypothetical protein
VALATGNFSVTAACLQHFALQVGFGRVVVPKKEAPVLLLNLV